MSTKTNFKRIALVAVSALGIGVLTSVAPASATYGGALVAADVSITSTAGGGLAANLGICVVSASASATVTTAATLTFTNAASSTGYIKVLSGPAKWQAAAAGSGSGAVVGILNESGSTWTTTSTSSATIKASAVGTVKITAFNLSDVAVEAYTITVVAACAGDAYSAGDSYFRTVQTAAVAAGTSNVDDSGTTDVATAGTTYIALALNDAYTNDLTTSGALVATATNGALVNISSDSAGTTSTGVKATAGANEYVRVDTPTAGTPVSTTVTVTFNGTVIGTKTITLRGWGTKLVITDITVGKSGVAYTGTSTDGAGSFLYQWKDANGSTVPGGAVAASALTGMTGTLVTAVYGGAGTSTGNTVARAAVSPTTTTGVTSYGDGKFTCTGSTKSGSATLAVAGSNTNLDTVVSAPFTVTCGGALDTWTISTDKASYTTGDIGTLTVTGKDANGAMVTDIATLEGITSNVTIGGGATFVTTPVSADTFTKGVKTYKFLVGNTEGNYGASVTITGATDITAKTVQYKVASGTATVSNADVLKSIVALIASINKQIQALQKLILKR